jgi:hypothetical protein
VFHGVPAILLCLVASRAAAEEFSWEVSGGYAQTELAPYADTERTRLDATYHFDPVDDTGGPYALAAFLNRSTRITAGVMRDKTTIETPVASYGPPFVPSTRTTAVVTEDTTGYALGGRHVWLSGWYAGASYRNEDMDHEPSSPFSRQDTTIDGYQLFGGRYFGDSTSVDLGAGAARQTSELVITCITSLCLSGNTATHVDTDDWSIGTLHVRRGARLSYSITGRVARADVTPKVDELVLTLPPGAPPLPPAPPGTVIAGLSVIPFTFVVAPFTGPFPVEDQRDTYSIGGELFPTDRLGFRIGFARSEGDYIEDESYDVATTWFFKRGVAVEFRVTRTESEIGFLERNVDGAEIRFLGRL